MWSGVRGKGYGSGIENLYVYSVRDTASTSRSDSILYPRGQLNLYAEKVKKPSADGHPWRTGRGGCEER